MPRLTCHEWGRGLSTERGCADGAVFAQGRSHNPSSIHTEALNKTSFSKAPVRGGGEAPAGWVRSE